MRRKPFSAVLLILTPFLAAWFAAPARAQFGPIKLPSIPGVPGGGASGSLQQQATNFLSEQLAKELQVDPPLMLDQSKSLPQVPAPDDFKPTKLTSQADLTRPLPPGDYAVDVNFFCTKYSIHRGGQGVPYKMGRAQGRLVKPMCALLNRGSLQGIAPATLNAEAWRMQDGIPLSKWPPADQALVHKLIP
ncbi:MAG TPA: hypothetical protein VFW40_10365, partial [Capsulimonadaceae bacterium]|nr:hypothetical protein [Capsulimonadaceae bacterium]